ncbi:cytosine permease [Virgibacillus sp. NKC19-3]|uniref:purine-cytosine permease family protein n=1 Tax=Virgibacillus saliphilus TaxID=2831674 RepID=UPI001C9B8289|nr:cytosine permease [Virgibacillus sp. NKC19-3]MBY7144285.1 cytosine permease [Virgibacillus sp. NKC19-3]
MSNQSKLDQVNNEVYYGILPVLHKERIYGFWDIFIVTGAYAIATWTYVQGGTIATLLGLKEAITSTIFSMLLVGLIIYLVVLIPTRYGIDLWLYQKALYGYLGLIIVASISIAASFGYSAINATLYGNSIVLLLDSANVSVSSFWKPWIDATCILLGLWIALKGPIAVKRATSIMVPCLFAIGIIIVFLVLSSYSLAELASIEPLDAGIFGSHFINYMMVMEWNISYIFAWFAVLGVLSRLVKKERTSYWGHIGGFSITMAIFICIGILTALAMVAATGRVSSDPTEWLIELGGPLMGTLSLVLIGVANITTQAVGVYSLSVSTKIVKPEWSYKKVAIFWSFWCLLLIFWGGILDYYNVFLSVIGATAGPMTALVLVDFFLIRKQQFSLRSIFKVGGSNAYQYTGGFNIPAFIALAAGMASYFFVYNPITFEINSGIFLYTTATGLALIVSSTVYYLISLFKPFNLYLKKDRDDETKANSNDTIKTSS